MSKGGNALSTTVEACRTDAHLAHERGVDALNRARSANEQLRAFIDIATEASLAPTTDGALAGATVSVKDNIHVAGFTTTCGSASIRLQPSEDPPLVRRIRNAGAHIIGKTNLGECALDATSNNPVFGAVANPHDLSRTPGGSSGGGGAAIAAGIGDIAIGTDSGGSVRIPAAFCGIASYRPTGGTWKLGGIEGPAWSVDSYGVMGRRLEDVGFFVTALAMPNTSRGAQQAREDVRIGYLADDSMGLSQSGVW